MSPYLGALKFALSRHASAYGFTLVIWGMGALAIWEVGLPDAGPTSSHSSAGR